MTQEHPTIPTAAPSSGGDNPHVIRGYRLLRRLGAGGSAVVWEAEHLALARRVAVKLLRREHAGDPRTLERVRFEAQVLATLRHPNVMAVTDAGAADDGRPFLVMELLQGRSLLRELRERGCLPIPEAIELMQQVLAGLAAAHAVGIVHRDVKLENLFLAEEGGRRAVKLLDFGVAKAMPGSTEAGAPVPPALPTQEGVPVGTPKFLSPEQARCLPVDARTDVYGAGMALYQLIAGRDPFYKAEGYVAQLQAHVYEMPAPPSALGPQPIPPEIDEVVLRAIAKSPEDRWASAEEFSWALTRAEAVLAPPPAPPAPPAPRRRWPRWVAPVVVAVASALFAGLATLELCHVL
jgi:serine/threonine-protein kinase